MALMTRFFVMSIASIVVGAGVHAQTVDEQLLAAQMAYQQANNQVAAALDKLRLVQEEKRRTDQRLSDVQVAAKQSTSQLADAESRLEAARATLFQVSEQLAKAWALKEANTSPVEP